MILLAVVVVLFLIIDSTKNLTLFSIVGLLFAINLFFCVYSFVKIIEIPTKVGKKFNKIFEEALEFTDKVYLRLKRTFKARIITCYISTFSGIMLFAFLILLPSIITILDDINFLITLIILTILSLLLVIGLLIRTYYLYFKFINPSEMIVNKEIETIITAEN